MAVLLCHKSTSVWPDQHEQQDMARYRGFSTFLSFDERLSVLRTVEIVDDWPLTFTDTLFQTTTASAKDQLTYEVDDRMTWADRVEKRLSLFGGFSARVGVYPAIFRFRLYQLNLLMNGCWRSPMHYFKPPQLRTTNYGYVGTLTKW